MSKNPPVALKKLANFFNKVHIQWDTAIEAVTISIPSELEHGMVGLVNIYFKNQPTISHYIKVYDNSIQFDMNVIKESKSMTVSMMKRYSDLLFEHRAELQKVIRASNIKELPNYANIFNMPVNFNFVVL